jgi:hypothetical protein
MATPLTDRARTDSRNTHSLWNPPVSASRQSSSKRPGVLAILCFRPRPLRSWPVCNWRVTPARLCAWNWMLKKVLEMKSRYNEKKTTGNNGEQSCRNGNAGAFRNIMELAHNICLSHLERNRSLKDKIKDLELSSFYKRFGSFKLRKYYLIGPA